MSKSIKTGGVHHSVHDRTRSAPQPDLINPSRKRRIAARRPASEVCGGQPADEAVRPVPEDDEADVRHDGQEEQERIIQSSFLIHMGIQVGSEALTYTF